MDASKVSIYTSCGATDSFCLIPSQTPFLFAWYSVLKTSKQTKHTHKTANTLEDGLFLLVNLNNLLKCAGLSHHVIATFFEQYLCYFGGYISKFWELKLFCFFFFTTVHNG